MVFSTKKRVVLLVLVCLGIASFPVFSHINLNFNSENNISLSEFLKQLFTNDNTETPKPNKQQILYSNNLLPDDTLKNKTKDSLKYPIKDEDTRNRSGYKNNIDLMNPSKKTFFEYNSSTGKYDEYQEVAGRKTLIRSLSKEEYMQESAKEERKKYFDQKAKSNAGESGYTSKKIDLIKTPEVIDKIFRGGLVDIQPSGSAEITLGGIFNTVRNPAFTARQQKTRQFDFDQKIQLNVNGKIGNALNLGIKYDTDATFDFDNQTKLAWQGKEDQMLRNVELGNVSLPLNGSLIQAGQSLFGIKTQWQFGKLGLTMIVTQNKGQRTETTVNGGAQITNFNIQAHNYDQNRHFFLAQFFRERYESSLSNLPVVDASAIINRVEVWVTNRTGNFENTRDVLTFMDLGERRPHNPTIQVNSGVLGAGNNSNKLYETLNSNPQIRNAATTINGMVTTLPGLQQGLDYDLLTYSRQLTTNEFTLNPALGYISLNTALNNDEMLSVAYEYTYNGVTYQVGEFASEVASDRNESKVLFLKMLKGNVIRTRLPIWNLMMKNIYSLGTFNINPQDFQFHIIYNDDPSGADLNYLPVTGFPELQGGNPLIRVMGLDRLNRQQEAKPDGLFDMLENRIIDLSKGRVIFPYLEPFGDHLRSKFNGDNQTANKYVFDALYDSTKWMAEQDVSRNKFFLKGSYKGTSSNEISLNALNVPKGSVIVTANGSRLTEGTDYIVDYNVGKVTILNQGLLSSGAVINVSAESNSMFNVQQKSLYGARLDYNLNRKTVLGGTILHMSERPLTPKTNIGDDPLLNTIIGVDGSYNSPSLMLTKWVDKLPFIQTKAPSNFMAQGEYARIFPGKARAMNKERGVSYIDDFEAAENTYDLRMISHWKLASLPQNQPRLFPEWSALSTDKTEWTYYRAHLAWYNIDPLFYRIDRFTPENVKNDVNMQSNHYMREVLVKEVFPNRELQQGAPTILPTLDLAFFPKTRGIYNYNSRLSDFDVNGNFLNPSRNWGGIMRRIETNDFEAANIDYIEIWMMDPLHYNKNLKGNMYINLGNLSEDVLPDSRKSFENGHDPKGQRADEDVSKFGSVPSLPQLNFAFDNEPSARDFQDIGLDGMNDDQEKTFFESYLNDIKTNFGVNSGFYQAALSDPSNDNYLHNRDAIYDGINANIINRYSNFNKHQGNATLDKFGDGTPKSATNMPDMEDINNDFTMNLTEDYYQYKIPISLSDFEVGKGYVTDMHEDDKLLKNGKREKIKWYQLKIPVKQYTEAVGNISDFRSIRFVRIFLKDFNDTVVVRMAQFQLVRADWRRHLLNLNSPGAVVPLDPNSNTTFSISTVNIEENGKRAPIRYVTPPGINRVQDPTSQNFIQQNEQSLAINVCNLQPGDARAAYKVSNFDIRNYKKFQMFTHAEGRDLKDGEISAFIRVGTDLISNYYEYEIPLKVTPDGSISASSIWPTDNEFDFDLEDLFISKEKRSASNVPLTRPFWYYNSKGHKVSIIGLPDLSNVRVIMLGVRNNSDNPKCAEVWFNEMRVSDISNKGGWAATGRMVAQMADFATISASGNITTIGFGGVDKRLNERSLSNIYQYDLASSFELGKFFPQKAGVNIPMFIGYSGIISRPKYNPLNPDVELTSALSSVSGDERNRLRKAAEDFNSRYSLNFTNVRINAGNRKVYPWSISNFNATYSYVNVYRRNIQIEEQFTKTHHGSLGYMYAPKLKPWTPFKKIKNKNLKVIQEFQFNKLPSNVNIRFDIDRLYQESQSRNNDLFRQFTPRLFDKNFTFNRNYIFNFPVTKNLTVNYNSVANARIEEPFGALNTQEKRDSVRNEVLSFGRMTDFNQTVDFNYNVPLNKIPLLEFINSSSIKYTTNYNWKQAPPALPGQGNLIQNSRDLVINTQFNFIILYNKSSYLRKINQMSNNPPKKSPPKTNTNPTDPNKKPDKKAGNKKEDKELKPNLITHLLRAMMMLRQGNINFTQNQGSLIPGFVHQIDYVGQNFARNAPGLPFIFGSQDENFRNTLALNRNLTNDPSLGNMFASNYARTITGGATLEPLRDFRIQLNFNLSRRNSVQSLFRYDTINGFNDWRDLQLTETGQFSMSNIFIRTAFENVSSKNNWVSPSFDNFENYRYVVAQRLQNQDDRVLVKGEIDPKTKYPVGYGPISQNVLIPAFFAAYKGQNQGSTKLSPFHNIPLPNWNVNYNGLTKIKSIAKKFSNLTIQHRYTGTYTVGGYTSNLQFNRFDTARLDKDLVSQYNINNITIREQFSPLIGVDYTTKKGITGGLKINRSRNVMLLVPNANVIENTVKELSFRMGYRTSDVRFPFLINGKKARLKNDLQMDLDISIQNNYTVKRVVDQNTNTPTAGQRVVLIRPNINYLISQNLNLQIYYDRRSAKPAVSNSFPTALTNVGFKLRYTLQ